MWCVWPDMKLEGPDYKPEKPILGSGGLISALKDPISGGTNNRWTDRRTDKHIKVPLCSIGLHHLGKHCPKAPNLLSQAFHYVPLTKKQPS